MSMGGVGLFNENDREIWPKGLSRTTARMQEVEQRMEQLPSRFLFSDSLLVLLQPDIDGFRAPQIRQCKAQSAGNGCSLFKYCNAAVVYLRGSRRAG